MTITITDRMDDAITEVFDIVTTHNCLTQEDIFHRSNFSSLAHVTEALAWIRTPEIAEYYGWTIPHVPRGCPSPFDTYRYVVVGIAGQVLSDEDIRVIQSGALSTGRLVATQTMNLAHALRTAATVSIDKDYNKWAKDSARILEGMSTQASLEVDRVMARLAAAAAAVA